MGRGTDQTRATLRGVVEGPRAERPGAGAGTAAATAARERRSCSGCGLELLHDAAGIPAFRARKASRRRMLRPDEERHNESLRRSAALWWRRHENEYRERSASGTAAVGKVTETRYGAWLGDLVRLDFGDSIAIRPEAPVTELLARAAAGDRRC